MRKDVFVLNPAAGKSDQTSRLFDIIEKTARENELDYEILVTGCKRDAVRLVKDFAAGHDGVTCRFYACGGDGTLNEVVCGTAGYDNAEVACFPCGTGNDFIKIFENAKNFGDIGKLVRGTAIPLDLMQINDRFAINLCSSGIDARIADWVGRNNHKVPFSGKLVYDISLALNFFRRLSRRFEVEIDGERVDGEYTIVVAASGRYYGGGYYAVPEAQPDDGFIDVLIIRKVTHMELLRLIGPYQNGRHSELGDYQYYRRARRLTIRSEKPEPVNYDGEIVKTDHTEITLAPKKLKFVVAQGSGLIR